MNMCVFGLYICKVLKALTLLPIDGMNSHVSVGVEMVKSQNFELTWKSWFFNIISSVKPF